jgi:hypothetical protein
MSQSGTRAQHVLAQPRSTQGEDCSARSFLYSCVKQGNPRSRFEPSSVSRSVSNLPLRAPYLPLRAVSRVSRVPYHAAGMASREAILRVLQLSAYGGIERVRRADGAGAGDGRGAPRLRRAVPRSHDYKIRYIYIYIYIYIFADSDARYPAPAPAPAHSALLRRVARATARRSRTTATDTWAWSCAAAGSVRAVHAWLIVSGARLMLALMRRRGGWWFSADLTRACVGQR